MQNSRQKFKNFDETFTLCSFALALGFMYPNRTNALKRCVLITAVILFNSGQLFWFSTYTFKCLYTLDIFNFARNMTLAVIVVLFFMKTYYAIYATQKYAPLLFKISENLLQGNELEEDYQAIYDEHIKQSKVGEKMLLMLPIALSLQFPIYAGIRMSIESVRTDDYTRLMVHDMELLYVEDIQSETPFFECMFAYNCIQCGVLAPNFCGFDGSFCIATTHLRLKLKLMSHKIRRAFQDAKNNLELRRLICEAVKDHQDALEFYRDIQNLYGPWLFAVFMLTSFMISFNLYQIYLLDLADLVDPKYTLFGILGVSLAYLPCYYAATLTEVGEQIALDIYCTPWEYCGDTSVTKTLMLMIARAQQPLTLTGWIVVYDMRLFKSIMQTSYSFFTLITA